MNRTRLKISSGWIGVITLILISFSHASFAQVSTYTQGSLSVQVTVLNPCNGQQNGSIEFEVLNTANGAPATLDFIFGATSSDFNDQTIAVGGTYIFNNSVSPTLGAGNYEFVIYDNVNTINTLSASVPPVTLTDLPTIVINDEPSTDLTNSDCDVPNAQIELSLSGGSTVLAGGGSFSYTLTTSNALPDLSDADWDGTGTLDLAAMFGQGLYGGVYELTITDNYSRCGQVKSWTIVDPSPALQTISTASPLEVCSGSDATIALTNTENNEVEYEIFVNGTGSGVSLPGVSGPLSLTLPTGNFSDNDELTIVAVNVNCTGSPLLMTGSVTIELLPLAVANAGADRNACQGSALTLTGTSISGGATTGAWTIVNQPGSGDGVLSSGAQTANPAGVTFTATVLGAYTLELTTNDPNGPCPEDIDQVIITVIAPPNAGADNTVSACNNNSAFDLFTSLGGTPAAGGSWTQTAGAARTITGNNVNLNGAAAGQYKFQYTVTGTSPCANASAEVTVNVITAPNAGANTTVQACNTNSALNMFTSLTGSPDAGGSWLQTSGAARVITGDNVNLNGATAGAYQFSYTVLGTAPCGNATSVLTVNVIAAPNAGADNTVPACNNNATFDLLASLGGTPDAVGVWSQTAGTARTIIGNNVNLNGASAGQYKFLYTVTGTAPCVNATAEVTVNVVTAPNAGTDNTVNACNTDATFNLFTSLGGTPDATGTWSQLSGTSRTITANTVDLNGATPGAYQFQYTVTGTSPCADAIAVVTVNVIAAPDAGSDNTVSACNNNATFDLFGNLGGTPDAGGTWLQTTGVSRTITGNNVNLNGAAAGQYAFQYTAPGTPPCVNAIATVTVNVIAAPNAGTDNTVSSCDNNSSLNLFSNLSGTPDVGGTWSQIAGGARTITGNNVDLNGATAGAYQFQYTVTGTAPCLDAAAVVTVNVVATPDAGLANTVPACNNDNAFDLFASLSGTPDAGGVWSQTSGTSRSITGNTVNLNGATAGQYIFMYTVSAAPCANATALVTVNVVNAPNAGSDNTVSACDTNAAFNLFSSLGGSPTAGGTWSQTSGSAVTITGNNVNLAGASGSYSFLYTVNGTAPCPPATATVTVNIVAGPDAGADNTVSGCNDDNSFNLFQNLGGTPDSGGSWTQIAGTALSVTGNIVHLNGAVAGQYRFRYTVTGTAPCGNASAIVTVNVTESPDAGSDNTVSSCNNVNAFNLFTSLAGSPDAGGTWTQTSGSSLTITGNNVNLTGAAAGAYVFEYTIIGCATVSAEVTVNVSESVSAGTANTVSACNNNNAFDLFANLSGTPDGSGTWTQIAGTSLTITGNLVDLVGASAGQYQFQYEVLASAPCTNATAVVTVNVNNDPDAGSDNTVATCNNVSAFNLFNNLSGTPDAGGVWTQISGGTLTISGNNVDLNGAAAGQYEFQYTITGVAPCGSASAVVTVDVTDGPDAGQSSAETVCATETAYDLFANLDGTPDLGGTWTDLDNSGGVLTGGVIDFTGVPAGQSYRFQYTVTGVAPCVDATSIVTVALIDGTPDPGTDNIVDACNSETAFNLLGNLGGTPNPGGSWTDVDISGAVITGNLVNLSTLAADTYNFLYTVSAAGCGSASATVTINVMSAPDAGGDNSASACNDDTSFDLFGSLQGTPGNGGVWADIDGSGALIAGNNANLTFATTGEFAFTYTVTGNVACPDAVATLFLTINPVRNAGSDNTVTACNTNSAFDMFANLSGTPEAGGSWSQTAGTALTITGNNVDLASAAEGQYKFLYTVLGAAPCVNAKAELTINVTGAPDAGVDNTVSACNTEVAFDLFANLSGTPDAGGAWTVISGTGVTLSGNTVDLTAATAGAYLFEYTVTGTTPCADAMAQVTVNVMDSPNAGDDNTVSVCNSENAFDLFANLGGAPDAGGSWLQTSGPSITLTGAIADFTNGTAGQYTFEYSLTAAAPCVNPTAVVTVDLSTPPDAGADNTVSACNTESAFDLFASLSGTPDAGGSWTIISGSGVTLSGNTVDLTAATAGAYVFEYTLAGTPPCAGSSAQVTVNVVISPNPGSDNTVSACNTDSAFDLFANLGGTPEAGGSWLQTSGPVINLTGSIADFTNGAAGQYTFEYSLTATAPCVNPSAVVTVNLSAPPDAGLDATVSICNDNNSFNLFTALGGTPNNGGVWAHTVGPLVIGIVGNNGNFFGAPAGAYVFQYTVAGIAPCPDDVAELTVNVSEAPDAGISDAQTVCNSETAFDLFAVLGGTPDPGGFWIDLDNSGGIISGNNIDLSPVTPANGYRFRYTVAGIGGCTDATSIVTLDVINGAPDAGSDATVDGCNNNNAFDLFASLGGTPNPGGTWTDVDVSGATITGDLIDLTTLSAQTYHFTYTLSVGGCGSSSATVTVNINDSPDAGAASNVSVCYSENALDLFAALAGTPDTGGTWTDLDGSGAQLTGSVADFSSIPSSGIFRFQYTITGGGCPDASAIVTVDVSSEPVPVVLPPTDASCNGSATGSITIQSVSGGNGPYQYSIYNGDSLQVSNVFANLAPGNYQVVVSDANGCLSQPQTQIVGTNTIITPLIAVNHADCEGVNNGSIIISSVSGGTQPFSYSKDNGVTFQASNILNNLKGGTVYTVVVRDSVGCLSSALTYNITNEDTITHIVSNTDVASCLGNNGTIEVDSVIGGKFPYKYSILNGTTFQDDSVFTGLDPGDYQVLVRDADGCRSTATTISVDVLSAISVIPAKTDADCAGKANGTISVSATGGTAPYTFSFDNGDNFGVASSLDSIAGGTAVDIIVKDSKDCISGVTTIIISDKVNDISATIEETGVSACVGNDGTITISEVQGGTGPYEFSIDGGDNFVADSVFSGLTTGRKDVVIRDLNLCKSEETSVVIDVVGNMVAVVTPADATCTGVNNGTITISSVTGGTGPFEYSKDNGQNFQASNVFTLLQAGTTYPIVVRDSKTCRSSVYQIMIGDSTEISQTITVTNASSCGGNSGSIAIEATGGVEPYGYSIDNGAFDADSSFTLLSPKTYTLKVSDARGCVSTASTAQVILSDDITFKFSPVNSECNGLANGSITFTSVRGGTAPYRYSILNGDDYQSSAVFSGLVADAYSIKVIDTLGCESNVEAAIIKNRSTISMVVKATPATCDDNDGIIEVTNVTGGTAPYTFSTGGVSGSFGNEATISLLPANVYSVVVKDDAGCLSVAKDANVTKPSDCDTDPGEPIDKCTEFTTQIVLSVRPSCNDQDNGIIEIKPGGGTPTGSYIVTLFDSLRTPSPFTKSVNVIPGSSYIFDELSPSVNYFYKVTDGNFTCTLPFSLPLQTLVDASTDPASFKDAICFDQPTGEAVITATGGNSPYQYSINEGADWITFTSPKTISDLPPNGTYSILVRDDDDDQCPDEVSVTINNPPTKITADKATTEATCNNNDGEVEISNVTGGDAPYEIAFQGGLFESIETNKIYDDQPRGIKRFTIRDSKGCVQTDSVNVPSPNQVILESPETTPPSCESGGSDGSVTIAVNMDETQTPGPYKYGIALNGEDENNITLTPFPASGNTVIVGGLEAGAYFVLASSEGGCPTRQDFMIAGGATAVDFDLEMKCDEGGQYIRFTNLTGEDRAFDILVFNKDDGSRVDSIRVGTFPITQSHVLRDRDFLSLSGDYLLGVRQDQLACVAPVVSEFQDILINAPLTAWIDHNLTSASYPDLPSGSLVIKGFAGGAGEYTVSITLDSAITPLTAFERLYEPVEINNEGQSEKFFKNILPAGQYKIEVEDAIGCVFPLEGFVPLDISINPPTVFTPNGDGINDVFYIRNLPEGGTSKLIVTNRWGKEVYSSGNYKNDWQGAGAADGIYYYSLQISGAKTRLGWFEIMRGPKP